MKGRIFLVVLLVIVAACAGRWVTRTMSPRSSNQEEMRQSVRLESGARVEGRGINGSVEVNTADTDTAHVHIIRTASSADDLEYGQITVDASSSGLVCRGENNCAPGFWHWRVA